MEETSPSRAAALRRSATVVTMGSGELSSKRGREVYGKPGLVRPSVTGAKLGEVVAALPPCLTGMEGSLRRAPLGAPVRCLRPHRQRGRAGAPKFVVPYRLSDKRQRRRGRHLRSGAAAEHALRAGENRTAAVRADGASRAPGLRRAAHRDDQPHPRVAQRSSASCFDIGASFGVACWPQHVSDADALLGGAEAPSAALGSAQRRPDALRPVVRRREHADAVTVERSAHRPRPRRLPAVPRRETDAIRSLTMGGSASGGPAAVTRWARWSSEARVIEKAPSRGRSGQRPTVYTHVSIFQERSS